MTKCYTFALKDIAMLKNLRYAFLFSAMLSVVAVNTSFARFGNPFQLHKLDFGGNYIVMTAKLKYSHIPLTIDGSGAVLTDTTISNNADALGYGYEIGLPIPVIPIGNKGAVILNVGFWYNKLQWLNTDQLLVGTYTGSTTAVSVVLNRLYQYAIPVGADLKFGGDAHGYIGSRLGIAVGGGVIPQWNISDFAAGTKTSASAFTTVPYLKAEINFMASSSFAKVKVYYTMGDFVIFNDIKDGGVFPNLRTSLTGNSNIVVSVSTKPFSYGKFRKMNFSSGAGDDWYRNYKTRLPYR
ncbi:MAG: hypothetical protein EBX41_06330 [Chitinophagia bacterium]|nr:hypothetical protein [Chitinophagia bacterium]